LEATQIATNDKLTKVEAAVANVDKSLVALLKCFDDFHTIDKEKHKKENREEERVDNKYDDDYTADTEWDDQDTCDRRRLHHNRRDMGGHR